LGIALAYFGKEMPKLVIGSISGVNGIIAIAYAMLNNPLKNIQKSVVDLVQIETAFTGFIWELNVNNAYIQSQYVSKGVLSDADISRTMSQITAAVTHTMQMVEQYTEPPKQKDEPSK
jgi:hypothetical protein